MTGIGPFLVSYLDPCPCGYWCELERRHEAMRQRFRPTAARTMVDELIYRSYRKQRQLGIEPEEWAAAVLLPDLDAMEQRYQRELEVQR